LSSRCSGLFAGNGTATLQRSTTDLTDLTLFTSRRTMVARSPIASRTSRGFTLIELMIVVVIVGVLAAVAYPSFLDQIVRGRIATATNLLGDKRSAMEQWFLSNRTYVGGPCTTSTSVDGFAVVCSGTGNPAANSYTITATGSGLAGGLVYTLDHHGNQATTGIPSSWGTLPTGGYPCWLQRKGQTC
jgi:type IV pilus assembly protein PilE